MTPAQIADIARRDNLVSLGDAVTARKHELLSAVHALPVEQDLKDDLVARCMALVAAATDLQKALLVRDVGLLVAHKDRVTADHASDGATAKKEATRNIVRACFTKIRPRGKHKKDTANRLATLLADPVALAIGKKLSDRSLRDHIAAIIKD